MKRITRIVMLFTLVTLFALLAALSSTAAPAAPGAHDGAVCKSHVNELITLDDIAKTAAVRNKGPMRAPSLSPATSDLPLVIVVIGFSDVSYRTDYDWSESIFRDSGSLAEYYSDMSFGRFTFPPARESSAFGVDGNTNNGDEVNDGIIHVTLDIDHDDWTLEYPFMSRKDIATNRSLAETLIAAIGKADRNIDFSAYDVNRDGKITTDELALGFIVAGYEASTSYNNYQYGKNSYLWSHAYTLTELKDVYGFDYNIPSPDGAIVNSYITIAERNDNGTQAAYSILAHELGHYIGLPDLYDTSYSSGYEWSDYSIDTLSLMSYQSWNDPATGEEIPTPLDAWSRSTLGWITPEAAGEPGIYSITAQNYTNNTGYNVLRIQTQNPGEYYLLENRAPNKWDAPLVNSYTTVNGGLVFWHVDENICDENMESNTVNNPDHRPGIMPVFPEKDRNGAFSFTGKNSSVLIDMPFFDRTVWNEKFISLGNYFDLPIYASGSGADSRSGRTLSGIKLELLSEAGGSINVRYRQDAHQHRATLVTVNEPSCTQEGRGYYECLVCGKHFTDEACSTETTETVRIPALGHTSPDADGRCRRCGEYAVSESELCAYCHKYHNSSLMQRLTAFFHRILYFFTHLFG